MGLHQRVHLEGTGVAARLMLPDILIEIVGMEGAEQTAARFGLQPPCDLVVGVALGPCPAHFHQRIAVDE